MPLFRQIHLLINATILKAREQLPTLNTTPPLLSLFWLCLILCYNEGRVDDHHIFWMQRKQTLLKNSALRDEKIGIFKCTRACEKLACRNQSPSLQHIPVHINKLKVSNFRVSEYWGGIQHQQWNTELSDVRSWVGITSHLEKTLSRFLLLIRRRRAQTDSKDFPYLLLYSIYGESGFDRLMRVWSVFSACYEFDPALAVNQSDKCTVKYKTISWFWDLLRDVNRVFKIACRAGATSQACKSVKMEVNWQAYCD